MAETTVRQLLISALLLGSIITGGFVFLSSFIPSSNIDATTNYKDFNRSLSKFEELNTQSNTLSSSIESAKPSSGLLGILNGLVETSWGALKLSWDSITTTTTIINDVSKSSLNLPGWFSGLMISIIVIIMAFAIMAAIFKWHI